MFLYPQFCISIGHKIPKDIDIDVISTEDDDDNNNISNNNLVVNSKCNKGKKDAIYTFIYKTGYIQALKTCSDQENWRLTCKSGGFQANRRKVGRCIVIIFHSFPKAVKYKLYVSLPAYHDLKLSTRKRQAQFDCKTQKTMMHKIIDKCS